MDNKIVKDITLKNIIYGEKAVLMKVFGYVRNKKQVSKCSISLCKIINQRKFCFDFGIIDDQSFDKGFVNDKNFISKYITMMYKLQQLQNNFVRSHLFSNHSKSKNAQLASSCIKYFHQVKKNLFQFTFGQNKSGKKQLKKIKTFHNHPFEEVSFQIVLTRFHEACEAIEKGIFENIAFHVEHILYGTGFTRQVLYIFKQFDFNKGTEFFLLANTAFGKICLSWLLLAAKMTEIIKYNYEHDKKRWIHAQMCEVNYKHFKKLDKHFKCVSVEELERSVIKEIVEKFFEGYDSVGVQNMIDSYMRFRNHDFETIENFYGKIHKSRESRL